MKFVKGSLLLCLSLVWGEEVIVDAPKIITKEWEERVFGIKQDARELPRAVHEMIDGILDDTFEKDFFERIDTAVKKQPKGEGVYTEYWPNGTLKAKLPFKDDSFDFVMSINTVHNLNREDCAISLQEIERVSRGDSFITVDAYRNDEEKARMEAWNLTALTMMAVDEWKEFFLEIGYTGDFYWFIP